MGAALTQAGGEARAGAAELGLGHFATLNLVVSFLGLSFLTQEVRVP